MFFKEAITLFISGLFLLLVACGDEDKEANLINLHTLASQDIISIHFPADLTENIISTNSEFNFVIQGVKSNNTDTTIITRDIVWSLSDHALSTIDQQGHFLASNTAELITLTAQFGPLIETLDLKISDAKFDEVLQLNKQNFNTDMCQSQEIKPIARYIDKDGNEEIHQLDSNTINTITWLIRNQEDNSTSQRAHIKTLGNQTNLHALAAGDIIIQAKALSIFTGTEKTSTDFNQNIGNNLNSIKVCNSDDSNLSSCNVTSTNIEKDKTLSLMSVGNYQASDGSSFNLNISQNSKWGINNTNASIAFFSDFQNLSILGNTESSTATLTVACGTITQSLSTTDITQGVILDDNVSCDGGINCMGASTAITISQLSVSSFTVSANNIDLTDNTSETLSSRPDEITLEVIANFTDSTSKTITTDSELSYSITAGDDDVIEDKADSSGVFTVLGNGTAKIEINYRSESFIVYLEIP